MTFQIHNIHANDGTMENDCMHRDIDACHNWLVTTYTCLVASNGKTCSPPLEVYIMVWYTTCFITLENQGTYACSNVTMHTINKHRQRE